MHSEAFLYCVGFIINDAKEKRQELIEGQTDVKQNNSLRNGEKGQVQTVVNLD